MDTLIAIAQTVALGAAFAVVLAVVAYAEWKHKLLRRKS